MNSIQRVFLFALALGLGCFPTCHAEDLTGSPYSISNGFMDTGNHPMGSHFHSSNLDTLPVGNPVIPNIHVAEVGGFFGDEEVRGLVEIDVDSAPTADEAILLFDVYDVTHLSAIPVGGIFGQGPLQGTVELFGYTGNNMEELADYQITPVSPLFSFDASSLAAGETIEVDITDFYNGLIGNSDPAAGFRLQVADSVDTSDANTGAITFDNFRIALVPEPRSLWFAFVGLVGYVLIRPRRR